MTEVATFVKELGGPAAVAEKIGRKLNAVQVSASRNKLPRGWWPDIISAFPGVTIDRLKDLESSTVGGEPVRQAGQA